MKINNWMKRTVSRALAIASLAAFLNPAAFASDTSPGIHSNGTVGNITIAGGYIVDAREPVLIGLRAKIVVSHLGLDGKVRIYLVLE